MSTPWRVASIGPCVPRTGRPGTVQRSGVACRLMEAHGSCDARFEPVRRAFIGNFEELGEVGAAVAVHIDGQPVVDLWGGVADVADDRLWERDTLALVFSTTKGWTAMCAL